MTIKELKIKYNLVGHLIDVKIRELGKILKNGTEEDALDFYKRNQTVDKFDFRAPAKCQIVATSGPIEEFAISKLSNDIQKYIYALSQNDISLLPGSSKEEINGWLLKSLNIDNKIHIQGLNYIIDNAKDIFNGVIVKAKNRNNKIKQEIERKNKDLTSKNIPLKIFTEEQFLDGNGKLIHPPGINKTIYCYSNVSPEPFSISKINNIPEQYTGYFRNPNEKITHYLDRSSIIEENPGYIPERYKDNLKTNKRQRKWYSNQRIKQREKYNAKALLEGRKIYTSKYSQELINKARAEEDILGIIKIKNDWVLFDMRGLLRNLKYRKLVPNGGLSTNEILDLFSGDPQIDPIRNEVVFMYKEGVIKSTKKNVISYKKSPEIISKLVSDKKQVGIVSIDLGQINPQAARFSKITANDQDLKAEHKCSEFLSNELLNELSNYRKRCDKLELDIRTEALSSLSNEFKKEFEITDNHIEIMKQINNKFNIDISEFQNEMSERTTFISDILEKSNTNNDFKSKYTGKNKTDLSIVKEFREVSKEARKALSDKIWEIKRVSNGFKKLSKSKSEFANRCVNETIKRAKEYTGCNEIIFSIEKLNIDDMRGSGRREKGFKNFFIYKKENGWIIPPLHKAYSNLAPHKGINVIKIHPPYTSMTCIKCNHQDKKNRNGDKFKCLNCSFEANTDRDIATYWIEKIALTGKPIPKVVASGEMPAKLQRSLAVDKT